MSIWIFSNKVVGENEDSDWDTSTILKRKRYYFKASEPNRTKVVAGDSAILREYGTGLWGPCEVTGEWVKDPDTQSKHEQQAGWFPITKIQKWDATLAYELVKEDLSKPQAKKCPRNAIVQATQRGRFCRRQTSALEVPSCVPGSREARHLIRSPHSIERGRK